MSDGVLGSYSGPEVPFWDPIPVSGQPNALTGEPNSCPGGGCLTITSESPKRQGVVVRRGLKEARTG